MKHRAAIPALCQYMQESAWNHAKNLKLGHSHLSKNDMAWVLCKQLVRIQRFPHRGKRSMSIHYMNEAFYLDKIDLFFDENDGFFVHQLEHQDKICKAKTIWKK